ncbi:MAG: Wzz/FepE/Etk N-terminal domain-containing protein, partial [Dialister sp.]|nr:Wzz/FepE/Etk N-terminal domain-containing protein [Dialister sp.]
MNEQEIDLLELWQVLNNNKRKIAYITGGFVALSCAYLIIVPPTYQSTSLLRIKQDKGLSDSILSQMPLGNTQMTQQKMNTVGLSNICYTVLDEIIECIFWRFPSKRAHWEAVIISIIISFELYSEI